MPKYRSTFIAPDPVPPKVQILPPAELPPAPVVAPMPHSNHVDRARGFVLVTLPLAGATGFVTLLIAISAFAVPVLSVAALLCVLAGFVTAWLLAYVTHTLISPDGSLFIHVVLAWAYLRREQKDRHRRYGK